MILGIETSTRRLSVALADTQGNIIGGEEVASDRRHHETLMPACDALLTRLGKTPAELTGVAVGLGPGSFSGVRIGIATALGLGQALGIPVAGVSSFLTLASQVTEAAEVVVLADARQDKLYVGRYARQPAHWETVWPEQLMSWEELLSRLPGTAWHVTGPEQDAFFQQVLIRRPDAVVIPDRSRWPRAENVIRLAKETLQQGGMQREDLVPIYLRRPQAESTRLGSALPGGA